MSYARYSRRIHGGRQRGHRPSVLALAALIAALVSGSAQGDALYEPADSLYRSGPSPDYAAYVAGTRPHLEAYAVAVEGFPRSQQIEWRLPFEEPPASGCDREETAGLLLVHGLADTPSVFCGTC